jgi:formylmethanofuran dehydrogenase subunit C
MITLTLKEPPSVPLEAEVLSPDVMQVLSNDAIRALPVYLGKRQRRLDDFFDVDGAHSDEIAIYGDAARVKWIGRAMTRGRISVTGNAGMHLGAYMTGGTIDVSGNGSDWVGAEMSGGLIRIGGNAGGQIGAAYRGSMSGMRDGTILVGGSAGLEVGMRMKRGTIAVRGPVRDFAGLQMKGGTIVLGSGAELRTGAWMMRGTIISLRRLPLMATFLYSATYVPGFLRIYSAYLDRLGFPLPCSEQQGAYERYTGDTAVPGKGEILIWAPRGA